MAAAAAAAALTITWPLGVSGSSHWITIVVELNGLTCTFFGADPGSISRKTHVKTFNKVIIHFLKENIQRSQRVETKKDTRLLPFS